MPMFLIDIFDHLAPTQPVKVIKRNVIIYDSTKDSEIAPDTATLHVEGITADGITLIIYVF